MNIPVNHFKRAIQAGTLQIGVWAQLASSNAVEVLAGSGYDWLVIDTEHAPNELTTVNSQLQAAVGGTAHPVVRVPWNDMIAIKRYLDIGAQSLLIPYIETAEQAQQAVAYTRYPPFGVRGYSSAPRASFYGRVKDYPSVCEAELCVLLQIETRLGLENIEQIAAVEGVTGLFIGPGDLAAALGHLGNPGHPQVVAAIEDAIRRIRACGKPAGILTTDETMIRRFIECGCVFAAVGSDVGILARASERLAAKFRSKP
ncbi:MAG TPA: HpcH/HpaI aldolase/citrate lyase family protein [Acidobacteriaceae bacterium]|nr:HpcH/HpaI aldolase/citrate lyase family protein [Acidobacteriaceae bacterium]